MVELVAVGETPLRFALPAHQRLEEIETGQFFADGIESNTAVAANMLGTEARWVSVLPRSPLGVRVERAVKSRGPDTDVTWVDEGRQGLLFMESVRDPRESRHLQDREHSSIGTVPPEAFPMPSLREARLVMIGLSTAVLSQDCAENMTKLLRIGAQGGATTAVAIDYREGLADPNVYHRILEEMAPAVDIVFASHAGAKTLLDSTGDVREVTSDLALEYDIPTGVVTRKGHGGAAIDRSSGRNVVHEREGYDIDPVDDAGNLGAAVGAYCNAILDGARPANALEAALVARTLARTTEGPFLSTTPEEFEAVRDRILGEVR